MTRQGALCVSSKHQELEKMTDPRNLARIAIFHGPYQKQVLTDYAINISTGGVFIESSRILPEDTEVTVKLNLPDSDTILIAKARVAWTNNPDSLKRTSLPSGMGLLFVDLSMEDMNTLREVLYYQKFVPTW
jgi:uncharacterized protein (TIGR02266 family)